MTNLDDSSKMDFDYNFTTAVLALILFFLLVHVIPYINDPYKICLNSIPGPFVAKFSDIWLGWHAAHGHRSEVVHSMHDKYGEYDIYSFLVKLLAMLIFLIKASYL